MGRLREAVEIAEQFSAPSLIRELAEAARSVLDAPRIWWCEEHRQATAPSSEHRPRCIWGDLVDNQQPCRMVEASVVVGPHKKEESDESYG